MSGTNINGKDDGRLYWKNLANILRQELTDTKKKLEDLERGSRGACFACEPVGIKNQQLEAFKKEALEVIGFYGNKDSWRYKGDAVSSLADNDLGYVARSFLQKHTTKMEG